MKRITILAASGVLVATPAIGAWAAVAATDDTPARDTSNVRVDDRAGHGRHSGEPEPGDDHGRHQRHGADDPAGHARHGADDPAGHVRHSGELEPGDDHGGHGELEPGDDHGGHSGPSGDDSGGDD